MITISSNLKVKSFIPNDLQLISFAKSFIEVYSNWKDYDGDPFFINKDGIVKSGLELHNAIAKSDSMNLLSIFDRFNLLPDKLYSLTDISSNNSFSLPIYTDIIQISLEGNGSVIAEAFFGAEIHLLDANGTILSRYYDRDYTPSLGLDQQLLIDYNSQNNSFFYDDNFVEIVKYNPECLNRSFTFNSIKGNKYFIKNSNSEIEQKILGTGSIQEVNNLKFIGKYDLGRKAKKNELDYFPGSFIVFKSHFVGQEWNCIKDFTIQYNTFPFLDDRDKWIINSNMFSREDLYKQHNINLKDIKLIKNILNTDPYIFQFLPLEIRSDMLWVEKFSIEAPVNFLFADVICRNNLDFVIGLLMKCDKHRTIYPYLPENLRKNLLVLKVLKQKGMLFSLPDIDEIGILKCEDIKDFVNANQDHIDDVLKLFPNALQFAP